MCRGSHLCARDEDVWGTGGIAPPLINLGAMSWCQIQPSLFGSGEEICDQCVEGGVGSRNGLPSGENRKVSCLCWDQNLIPTQQRERVVVDPVNQY